MRSSLLQAKMQGRIKGDVDELLQRKADLQEAASAASSRPSIAPCQNLRRRPVINIKSMHQYHDAG